MQQEAVEMQVDGQTMRGRLYTPQGDAKPLAVLLLHGWTGRANYDAAAMLTQHGYHVLALHIRGHGDSDGDINKVTFRNGLDDVTAAYDFLAAHIPAGMGIAVVGNSYGGYMAALLSRERPVVALSLRVPAAYTDDGFDAPKKGQGSNDPAVMEWRHTPHDWQGNRGFEAMHAFAGPVQIIEAESDADVPHQTLENFKAAVADPARLEYHFMKGWPHSLGSDPERNRVFQELLLNWLDKVAAGMSA